MKNLADMCINQIAILSSSGPSNTMQTT